MKLIWKIIVTILVIIIITASYFGYKILFKGDLEGPPIRGKIEKYTFHKEDIGIFGINQDVKTRIFLPTDFDNTKRYPLIFLLDGDNMFTGATGYLSQMISDKVVPEAVLVGIGYGYLNGYLAKKNKGRWRDYTFPEDTLFGQTANGPGFYKFLSQRLVPVMIERFHGIQTQSTLIGHSMGGDFTYYAFLQYNPAFGDKNPFVNFIIGDGGDEEYFASVYNPAFESVMSEYNNKTHTVLNLYRIWGYLTNSKGIDGQEAMHKWLVDKNYDRINAFRYYPLRDNHAATMKTTVINGIKFALRNSTFLDYNDSSSFHF